MVGGVHHSFMLAVLQFLRLQMDLHTCCWPAGLCSPRRARWQLSARGRAGRCWFSIHSCVCGLGCPGLCESLAFSFMQGEAQHICSPRLSTIAPPPSSSLFLPCGNLGDLVFYLYLPIVAKTCCGQGNLVLFPCCSHAIASSTSCIQHYSSGREYSLGLGSPQLSWHGEKSSERQEQMLLKASSDTPSIGFSSSLTGDCLQPVWEGTWEEIR